MISYLLPTYLGHGITFGIGGFAVNLGLASDSGCGSTSQPLYYIGVFSFGASQSVSSQSVSQSVSQPTIIGHRLREVYTGIRCKKPPPMYALVDLLTC